uniref:Uncharacterized protein n=1 Tax=Timema poppense TaxID=170557 RepID=A0A7R9DIX9_TIMPO|nr:unnamed protein product [Timema poppensis]
MVMEESPRVGLLAPELLGVLIASYITALPYLAGWLSNVVSGITSQWLRHKGYVSHMTAYRIFNGICALGPAVSLILITQVGCDSVSIIVLFTITLLFNGCYFGGSMLGIMDLGVNFAGTMSGISGTITGVTGIIAPTIVGAVTNNHQTRSSWSIVFYISSAMSALPYISFLFFGSVQEQPWNKFKVAESNSDLIKESGEIRKAD